MDRLGEASPEVTAEQWWERVVRRSQAEVTQIWFWTHACSRAGGPPSLGHGPVCVHGLLGTGPHSRRWAWIQLAWIIPKPSATSSLENLSSRRLVPAAKRVEDRCSRVYILKFADNCFLFSRNQFYLPTILFFCQWSYNSLTVAEELINNQRQLSCPFLLVGWRINFVTES